MHLTRPVSSVISRIISFPHTNTNSSVEFEVFTEVTMKNAAFWDVAHWGLLRTDVSE
jgi:hypothetical protein